MSARGTSGWKIALLWAAIVGLAGLLLLRRLLAITAPREPVPSA